MRWQVQLIGDSSDLAALSESLTGPDINISHDGKEYILTSSLFDETEDAQAIKKKADNIFAFLNGGMRIALDAVQTLAIGSVYHQNDKGGRDITVFTDPLVIMVRVTSPTVCLTHVDGTVEKYHPADPIEKWTLLALRDMAVADVMTIISFGNLDWVNLYRILEIIKKDAGGIEGVVNNGWGVKSAIKLFKHTACSPGAVGLEARHGAENTQPPKNPIPISEARAMISSIIQAWLRSKS